MVSYLSTEMKNCFYNEQTGINDTCLCETQQQDPVIRQFLLWKKHKTTLCHTHNVKFEPETLYAPWSNGLIKNSNRQLKTLICTVLDSQHLVTKSKSISFRIRFPNQNQYESITIQTCIRPKTQKTNNV